MIVKPDAWARNLFDWCVVQAFEPNLHHYHYPDGLHLEAKHVGKEVRFFRIGQASRGKVLIVVFTVRKLGRDKETIRIISARQTSKKEREAYRRLKN
jgi:uncharacterized DUF497 family protein